MTLPELSIRRHVLAWMLSAAIVLFGTIAYLRIGVDRFPQVDIPMISITTVQQGADPDSVANAITREIEDAVFGIGGVERVLSFSSPGVSVVTVQFKLKKDIDVAFNEVQAKVQQVLRKLPSGIDPPVVAKMEVGASPVVWFALYGDRSLKELQAIARDWIKPVLQSIEGAGDVLIGGERKRKVRIWLSLDRMQALGVDLRDVLAALRSQHLKFPGGFLVAGGREYMLKLDFEAHSIDALGKLVLRADGDFVVHLNDVARIEEGLADFRSLARFQGRPAIGIGVVKRSGANTVAVVEEAKRRVREEILPRLPGGVHLVVATDDARIIRGIVDGLKEHVIESVLLAALVVWFFLRHLGATLVVALTIPVSLAAAVAIAYFFGFTLNMLTLLAMLLLVGVVVDDAIVVIENIFRWREQGLAKTMEEAAAKGARQVTFAATAASLTLVSIFAPVIFMEGMVARFFQAFSVTVTFGVLASLLVAFTLAPMLAARHLRENDECGALAERLARLHAAMDRGYRAALAWALRYRKATLALAALVFVASLALFSVIGKGFVPNEDEGRFVVRFKLPLGSSIDASKAKLVEIEQVLSAMPEVKSLFSAVGLGARGQVNEGTIFVELVPKQERARPQWEVRADAQARLARIAGVRAFAARPSIVAGMRGEPLQFALTGPDLARVGALAEALAKRLRADPAIGPLDLDLQLDLPQLRITVDRARALDYGLSPAEVAQTIGVLVGGSDAARFDLASRRVDVRLKLARGEVHAPEDLKKIWLRSPKGWVRLDQIVRWQETLAPAVVQRVDLQYAAMFFSTPNAPLGDAIARVNAYASKLLPAGYRIVYMGQASEFGKTTKNILFAFLVAMALVFMVQASQFNSFAQPWILMLAQPLAVTGGVLALWLAHETLNIFSMIGLVLLVGLVAKNSILLVDLTNQYRAAGMGIDEALAKACPERMRPVVMTSATIVFAMLPTALGWGQGTDLARPLAVAVVGGVISSTLLTLIVVPAAYSLLMHALERSRR